MTVKTKTSDKTAKYTAIFLLVVTAAFFAEYKTRYTRGTNSTIDNIFKQARAQAYYYCDDYYHAENGSSIDTEYLWDSHNFLGLSVEDMKLNNQYFKFTTLTFAKTPGKALKDINVSVTLSAHPYVQKKLGITSKAGSETIRSETLNCMVAMQESKEIKIENYKRKETKT